MHPKQQQMLAWELSLTCRQGAMVQPAHCLWVSQVAGQQRGRRWEAIGTVAEDSRAGEHPSPPPCGWQWHLDSCCKRPKFPGLSVRAALCTVPLQCGVYGSSPLLDHKLHLHIIEKATLHQKKIVSYAASISISAPVPHQIHQDSNQLDCFEKVQTRNTTTPFLLQEMTDDKLARCRQVGSAFRWIEVDSASSSSSLHLLLTTGVQWSGENSVRPSLCSSGNSVRIGII